MRAFAVHVPPGWARLDLTGQLDAQVRGFVAAVLRGVPSDRAALVRPLVHESLSKVAADLASGGAVAMVMPVAPLDGLVASPTIVFMPLTVPEDQAPMDVLVAVAASDASASVVDVAGLVALRTISTRDAHGDLAEALAQAEHLVAGSTEQEPKEQGSEADGTAEGAQLTATATRVRYLIGDPGDANRWVDVLFSVTHSSLPGGNQIGQAAVELFDAMMHSFRWVA
ncbi:MAG: hypothetical protein IPL45_00330 [Actinomycetales bacterium]|nr:hypothetical protein [Actinomycetales bacterium]